MEVIISKFRSSITTTKIRPCVANQYCIVLGTVYCIKKKYLYIYSKCSFPGFGNIVSSLMSVSEDVACLHHLLPITQ